MLESLFSFDKIADFLSPERVTVILRIVITLIGGLVFFRFLAFLLGRATQKRLTPQASMIIRKFTFYFGAVIVVLVVLRQAGISLAALLGTAGVVGIALGFAAQKSISNLISGLFLISEKPFSVNDAIQLGTYIGIVTSVDLLSVKIRTFDNQYVRIPNEQILNTELVNITRYPIRRMNFEIGVSFRADLRRAQKVLMEIADSCDICLDEPPPFFLIEGFQDYSIGILFGVWFEKSDFVAVKNIISMEIRDRFEEEGIEIPYPHQALLASSVTDPFPVVLAEKRKASPRRGDRTSAGGTSGGSTGKLSGKG